ncbi:hypothetical protein PAJ34TS1_06540 [Paenibacillus azoreducens]|uniref:Uncharacterized protein n=1 Tax=Paenibacillus azoreducens TaxID=116718 RepID=A0A920CUA5_9BACL|nr:hypothetical protein J34TS1_48740 [Paenibacillus azoreducens]
MGHHGLTLGENALNPERAFLNQDFAKFDSNRSRVQYIDELNRSLYILLIESRSLDFCKMLKYMKIV